MGHPVQYCNFHLFHHIFAMAAHSYQWAQKRPTGSVYPLVFGRCDQLLLNKFFDLSNPFMKKGRNGEKIENMKIPAKRQQVSTPVFLGATIRFR